MASLKKLKQTTAQWGYLHRSANGQLLRLKKSAEEMDCTVPVYREAVIGEVHGAVLACKDAKLVAVAAGKFVDPLKCTDNLTNMIEARLPKCEK